MANSRNIFARIIYVLFWLVLSLLFLYSAYSKLFIGFDFHKPFFSLNNNFFLDAFIIDVRSFNMFRWAFIDLGINSMALAGILARLMIAIEFILGFFLLFRIFLRRFTLPAVITMLTVFIIYLLYVIAVRGNSGDCGCFGQKIEMTPLQAIIKNLLMMSAAIILFYLDSKKPFNPKRIWLPLLIVFAFLAIPFIIMPLHEDTRPPEAVNEAIDLNPLYSSDIKPAIDLRKGKHIVAFMSLTCPHCQTAAYLLEKIHNRHHDISMFLVLAGHKDNEPKFFEKSQAQDIPHMLYADSHQFTDFTKHPLTDKSFGVPAIYWINNGIIERKSNYYQLDPKEIENWMHNK